MPKKATDADDEESVKDVNFALGIMGGLMPSETWDFIMTNQPDSWRRLREWNTDHELVGLEKICLSSPEFESITMSDFTECADQLILIKANLDKIPHPTMKAILQCFACITQACPADATPKVRELLDAIVKDVALVRCGFDGYEAKEGALLPLLNHQERIQVAKAMSAGKKYFKNIGSPVWLEFMTPPVDLTEEQLALIEANRQQAAQRKALRAAQGSKEVEAAGTLAIPVAPSLTSAPQSESPSNVVTDASNIEKAHGNVAPKTGGPPGETIPQAADQAACSAEKLVAEKAPLAVGDRRKLNVNKQKDLYDGCAVVVQSVPEGPLPWSCNAQVMRGGESWGAAPRPANTTNTEGCSPTPAQPTPRTLRARLEMPTLIIQSLQGWIEQ